MECFWTISDPGFLEVCWWLVYWKISVWFLLGGAKLIDFDWSSYLVLQLKRWLNLRSHSLSWVNSCLLGLQRRVNFTGHSPLVAALASTPFIWLLLIKDDLWSILLELLKNSFWCLILSFIITHLCCHPPRYEPKNEIVAPCFSVLKLGSINRAVKCFICYKKWEVFSL